jgi:hypothetical protein
MVLRVDSHISFVSPDERSRPGFMGRYTTSVAFSDILGTTIHVMWILLVVSE